MFVVLCFVLCCKLYCSILLEPTQKGSHLNMQIRFWTKKLFSLAPIRRMPNSKTPSAISVIVICNPLSVI